MIKAVIFDMDGVLIDSEPLHFEAIISVLKKNGISIEEKVLENYVGDTNERLWAAFKKDYALPDDVDFYIAQQLQTTIEYLRNGDYKPIDGILSLLRVLKEEGFPVGVASSSPPVIIRTMLDKIGVAPYIDEWISGNEVQESKPAPFIYIQAAQRLGLAPEQCVAVEDSFYGVTAAKAAGLKCIGYKAPNAIEQDLSKADIVVSSISAITTNMIRSLN